MGYEIFDVVEDVPIIVAAVDPQDEDFGFLRPGEKRARLAGGSTEVEIAVIKLIGSPQFPFDAGKRNFLEDEQVAAMLWVPDPLDLPTATRGHRARWAAAAMRLLRLEQAIAFLEPDDPFLLAAVLGRTLRKDVTGPALPAGKWAWTSAAPCTLGLSRGSSESRP